MVNEPNPRRIVVAFPFYPIGAIVAGALLGGVLTLFVAALMAVDRGASHVAGSVLPGLVSGIRGWATSGRADRPNASSGPVGTDDGPDDAGPNVPMVSVRPAGPSWLDR